ncbi:hypothetical protein QVD17_22848 [Tagetes erecta]|uniref:MSP domain-containing protein n=1 Tax=Tagetes erecta TaxID=13708 RepID=A0AAD8KDX3_TARER|nr:hypothetical protein QVD17_22848 [Tagetes erecta]
MAPIHKTTGKPSLLGRLRTVVKKVTFLMNYNINRWRLASSIIGNRGTRALSSRRRSFNERLGLTSIVSSPDQDYNVSSNRVTPFMTPSMQMSPEQGEVLQKTRSFPLQRTTSFPEEDDVDKRAEMFISNFYRQLKMERQVSLQLRYTSVESSNYTISP